MGLRAEAPQAPAPLPVRVGGVMSDPSTFPGGHPSRRGRRRMQRRRLLAVFGVGPFALIGCVIGVWMTIDGRDFTTHQRAAAGVVVGMHTAYHVTDRGPVPYQAAVFRFTTSAGQAVEGQDEASEPMSAGQPIRVYYDLRDPRDARLDDGSDLQTTGIVLAVISLAAVLSGIALLKGRGAQADPTSGTTTSQS